MYTNKDVTVKVYSHAQKDGKKGKNPASSPHP
jgi:hypothetical protein